MYKKVYLIISSMFLILGILFVGYNNVNKKTQHVFTDTSTHNPTIIIDAGHGLEDGGAVSKNGLMEKDINLEIALSLEKFLSQGGFKVVMIRSTDTAIYDDTAQTLRDKKVSDIHNRSEICNNSENNIFISIHQNFFTQSQYKGTQIFFSKNDPESKTLAECIKRSVVDFLQNDNERQCKQADENIYILDKATVPAILIECGFLSNAEETKLLASKEYRNKLSYCIYIGFLQYYNENIK